MRALFAAWSMAALLLAAATEPAFARWAHTDEADATLEFHRVKYHVRKDLGRLSLEEIEIRILRDSARDRYGTIRFSYSPANSKFKVEDAYTKNGDKIFRVSEADILDTPIGSAEAGYDQRRQVVIPFKNVEIGTVIHYKIVEDIFRPQVQGIFSEKIWPGWETLDPHFEIEIQSEVPLSYSWADPLQAVKALPDSEGQGPVGRGKKLHFKFTRPVYHSIVNEVQVGNISDLVTQLYLSSEAKTETAFEKLAQKFEERLRDPLPDEFLPAKLDLKKDVPIGERLNDLLGKLAERLRYMGDWRAVDGALVPRTLSQIAKTHYGDCKDLSLLLTRVLRELGYRAHVALVWRGIPPPPKREHPTVDEFNHAISYVQIEGKDYWLDATNSVGFAQGAFEDIFERQGLILRPDGVESRWISALPASESGWDWDITSRMSKNNVQSKTGEFRLRGTVALSLAGQELRMSRRQVEDWIVQSLTPPDDLIDFKITSSDLKAREVRPLKIKIDIKSRYTPRRTSMGPAVQWPEPSWLSDLEKVDSKERISPLRLDIPQRSRGVTRILDLKMRGRELRPCRVKSPWFEFSASLTQKGRMVEGVTTTEVKQYVVSPAEVRSPEFSRLVKQLRECASDRFMVFRHL